MYKNDNYNQNVNFQHNKNILQQIDSALKSFFRMYQTLHLSLSFPNISCRKKLNVFGALEHDAQVQF